MNYLVVQVAAVVFSWLEFRTPTNAQTARDLERGVKTG